MGFPKADGFVKLSVKTLKAMPSFSSHAIGSGFLFFSKIHRGLAIRDPISAITNQPMKSLQLVLALGFEET